MHLKSRTNPTIIKHLAAYLQHKRTYGWKSRQVSDGRLIDIRRVLERFARDLPGLLCRRSRCVDIRLGRITPEAIERWRTKRLKSVTAGTVNKDLRILRAYGRWLILHGLWKANASAVGWMLVEDLPVVHKYPQPLERDEMVAALRALPLHVRLPVLGVFILGDRPGAVYALRWHDVFQTDDGTGFVRLEARKGGAPRSIPFVAGDETDQYLARARALFIRLVGRAPRGTDPLFVNKRRNPWHVDTMCGAIRYYLIRRHKRRGFRPYVLRHTLATMAAVANASASHVQALLGHERRSTAEVYTHLSGRDVVEMRAQLHGVWGTSIRSLLSV